MGEGLVEKGHVMVDGGLVERFVKTGRGEGLVAKTRLAEMTCGTGRNSGVADGARVRYADGADGSPGVGRTRWGGRGSVDRDFVVMIPTSLDRPRKSQWGGGRVCVFVVALVGQYRAELGMNGVGYETAERDTVDEGSDGSMEPAKNVVVKVVVGGEVSRGV